MLTSTELEVLFEEYCHEAEKLLKYGANPGFSNATSSNYSHRALVYAQLATAMATVIAGRLQRQTERVRR